MYHNRVKQQPAERTLYLITNRITGGSMIFGDLEKERLRRLLFEGEGRCGYEIWDYVIMGNHYHARIYIPKADAMPQAEVLRRWQEAEVAVNRPIRDDPSAETLDTHRQRIHDISFIAVTSSSDSRSGITNAMTAGVSCSVDASTASCSASTAPWRG
jgi:REP element-mobilizing transposase RayT